MYTQQYNAPAPQHAMPQHGFAPQQFAQVQPQYGGMPQQNIAAQQQAQQMPAQPAQYIPGAVQGQPAYGAPMYAAPQVHQPYTASPGPQRYAPPVQGAVAAPAPSSYTPPPVQLPMTASAPAPSSYTPPPVQLPMTAPAPSSYTPPPVHIPMGAPCPAPIAAAHTQPQSYVPRGGEMLQVTVFGTKNLAGAVQPTVVIEIPGKHKGTLETHPITGSAMVPKSLVTYFQPGEGVVLAVLEGEQALGVAELVSEDFYPNGVEGDLPLGDPNTNVEVGHLTVKIAPLGMSGQMAELAPVVVPAFENGQPPPAPQQAPGFHPTGEAMTVQGRVSLCSPEEFARLSAQPGAAPPMTVMPGDPMLNGLVQQAPQQPQHYAAPAQAAAPMHAAPMAMHQQPQQHVQYVQPQGVPVVYR